MKQTQGTQIRWKGTLLFANPGYPPSSTKHLLASGAGGGLTHEMQDSVQKPDGYHSYPTNYPILHSFHP